MTVANITQCSIAVDYLNLVLKKMQQNTLSFTGAVSSVIVLVLVSSYVLVLVSF